MVTLGIIGVVAALTMPVLISYYEKMSYKNQFKKQYSVLSNAITSAIYDIGGAPVCYFGDYSECTAFYDIVFSKLNVLKYCKGKALERGCIPENYFDFPSASGCSGFSKNRIENVNKVYILSDGATLIRMHENNTGTASSIIIDVNGAFKKPNIVGKDIFSLGILKDSSNNTYKFGGYNNETRTEIYSCVTKNKSAYFSVLSDLIN